MRFFPVILIRLIVIFEDDLTIDGGKLALAMFLTGERSAIFVFATKTTQPRPQDFSVNSALTCKEAALLTSSVD